VLRFRDVYLGSDFFHPGSRIQGQKDLGSRIRIKELKFSNPKIVSKLSKIWSGMFIPDPDLDFLPIPDPGSSGFGSARLAPGPPLELVKRMFRNWKERRHSHIRVFKFMKKVKRSDPDTQHMYGFLQAFFISKETPTAEWRKEKETLK
jgi:hypothetical protein